ncbi:MAG: UDP-2,3-diacylglucosamine diphosphatase [Bacteroidales bacterium]
MNLAPLGSAVYLGYLCTWFFNTNMLDHSANTETVPIRKTIYFVSDVHLGVPSKKHSAKEREAIFLNWLESIKETAHSLYILGDLLDFWFEYKRVVPKGFVRTFAKLAELAESGIEINFFSGNHDMWLRDYFQKELGINVYHGLKTVNIMGKIFFLGHGDELDFNDTGYLLLRKVLFTSRIARFLFRWLHPDLGMYLGHAWSNRKPSGFKPIWEFRGVKKEGIYISAEKELAKMHIDYFIFGHRHVKLQQTMSNNCSQFIILGEWVQTFCYGEFDGFTFNLNSFAE